MNRLTNGKNRKRRTKPRVAGNVARVDSRIKTQRPVLKKEGIKRKSKSKKSLGLKLRKQNILLLIFMCLLVLFAMNKNNISAYFTSIASKVNVFSIEATYNVTFDANTGTGEMSEQRISYNVSTPLSSNTYTKVGFYFNGWNTDPNGEGTFYGDGAEVNNIGDTTLYAQWKKNPIKYAVQIYGINEDVDANNNPLGLSFGPATGESFNSKYITHRYEETSSGSGIYNVIIVNHIIGENGVETTEEELLKDSSGNNVTRTTEEKNKYDINMHNMTWTQIAQVADKTAFLDCMLCGDTKSVNLNLNDVLGNGEAFDQPGDGAGTIRESINVYYRKWNPDRSDNRAATLGGSTGSVAQDDGGYSISHLRATLVGEDDKTDVRYAGNVNLTSENSMFSCLDEELQNIIVGKKVKYATGPSRTEYYLNDDIVDKLWPLSQRELAGTASSCGVEIEGIGSGGTAYSRYTNPESRYYIATYNNDTLVLQRKVFNEAGSPFNTWLRSINLWGGSGAFVTSTSGGLSNSNSPNREISVNFGFCLDSMPFNYTIIYNANGGTGSMENQSMKSTESIPLTANSFTKKDARFVGWNTQPDGSGTSYEDKEVVRGLATTNGEEVTLYAQWQDSIRYAVTIYGIYQDADENGNILGLTFGPATGENYNNKYVTHTYEETSTGSGIYNVKILTHTIEEDGTETITEEFLMDSEGNNVTRTTAEKNKYDINLHDMDWQDIKAVVDKTAFLDCMLCGDTKRVNIYLNDYITTGEVFNQPGDGAAFLNESIDDYFLLFNPSRGQNSGATNGGESGSTDSLDGGYSSSHVRATLIGFNNKTKVSYAGNINLTEENCLYSCIEDDVRAVITPKKVRYVVGPSEYEYTMKDDIVDPIWLLSQREEFGPGWDCGYDAEGIGNKGEGYGRYLNPESKYYIPKYTVNGYDLGRQGYSEDGGGNNCYLRSIYVGRDMMVHIMSGNVGLTNSVNSANRRSLAFGFCIGGPSTNYTVEFKANGGTGSMQNQAMISNVPANLRENTFTKSGYSFQEWNTKADGTGITYKDEEEVYGLSYTEGETVTLYAQWQVPTKYAVQIYGINEDIDKNGETLGLSFGPAAGQSFNNKYITHSYEGTAPGSEEFYVKIVTHDIASNGTDTISEAYLLDSDGMRVTRTLEEKNKYDVNLHNMTWSEIAAVTDKTIFYDCMLCGDTKSVELVFNKNIGIGNTYEQRGDGTGAIIHNIDEYYRIWNPNRTQNTAATSGGTDGSNARTIGGYSSSHIRSTLVGQTARNKEAYSGDKHLIAYDSLETCIEKDLRQVITAKQVKYVTGSSRTKATLREDLYDKIWMVSERELHGQAVYSGDGMEGIGEEGVGYGKFNNPESNYYISAYNVSYSNKRTFYGEDGNAALMWLRTVDLDGTKYIRNSTTNGALTSSSPCLQYGISFGFCIK